MSEGISEGGRRTRGNQGREGDTSSLYVGQGRRHFLYSAQGQDMIEHVSTCIPLQLPTPSLPESDQHNQNKLAKLRRHASRVHFANIHFGKIRFKKYTLENVDNFEIMKFLFQIWPPDGATCMSCKFGHQMAPLA